jgi:hypothetical protein
MLTNVHEIDQTTYKEILSFNIRTRGNMLVLGMAGTGKTEMAQAACADMGFEGIYLNLSVLEAPDLIGLPIITADQRVDYATPKFFPKFGKDSSGADTKPKVLIVDEIDKAKSELQNPLLELFQFHAINGNKLDIQAIIATGNLPDEGAFSQPISHALTNRCKVYKVTHNFESWREWAQKASVNPLVIGFLSKNHEWLSQKAVEGDPTAYCRPSPRSWSMAASDLDFTTTKDSLDFQTQLVAGRVGQSAALQFRVWLEHYRHIEPLIDDLVKTGKHPDIRQMEIDRILVTAISAINAVAIEAKRSVRGKDEEDKQRENVAKIAKNTFGWVSKLTSEMQVAAAKSTLHMDLITKFQMTKIPEVMQTFLAIRKAVKD